MKYEIVENCAFRYVMLHNDFNRADREDFKGLFRNLENLRELTINLSHLDFAGTDFINALLEIRITHAGHIHKLILCNPNESILEIFAITGILSLFNVEKSPGIGFQAVKAA